MNMSPQMPPGDKIVNKRRVAQISPLSFDVEENNVKRRSGTSPLLIVIAVFLLLISIGTLMLMLPIAHYQPGFSDPVTALFTATSAVTVTGLTVVETATHWTTFGQGVILVLMFVGGLGFMSLAAFLLTILGQRASISQRLLIRESLSTNSLGGIQKLSVAIVVSAIIVQLVGFLLLSAKFYFEYDTKEAIWQALFHSVSGFNNAGFVILPEGGGMATRQDDMYTLFVLGGLILIGSLSFWVVSDVVLKRRFRKYSLVSKIVVVTTTVLVISGAAFIFFSEGSNPKTLSDLPLKTKAAVSVFESISGRTAGFSTFDYSDAKIGTNLFMIPMMFVGGATASVAGGIKVSTLFIVVISVYAIVRERTHVTAFGREIEEQTIRRSYAILLVCLAFSFACAIALALSNTHISMKDITFEAISAFGTVGLTSGATSQLNTIGQFIITIAMFAGRIGPLLIGLKMVPNKDVSEFRYPSETVTIG
jgi:trk system potassium uptake protein TrkH